MTSKSADADLCGEAQSGRQLVTPPINLAGELQTPVTLRGEGRHGRLFSCRQTATDFQIANMHAALHPRAKRTNCHYFSPRLSQGSIRDSVQGTNYESSLQDRGKIQTSKAVLGSQ